MWHGDDVVQGALERYQYRRVRLRCNRPGCGRILDDVGVTAGPDGRRVTVTKSGFPFPPSGPTRPHVDHGYPPMEMQVPTESGIMMAWECKCGAVLKLSHKRLTLEFIAACDTKRRAIEFE